MLNIGTLPDRELVRGDTFTLTLTFNKNIDGVITPIDLTVYDDIKIEVRNNPNRDADKFITVSLNDGVVVSGNDNNTLIITMSKDQTDTLVTNTNQFVPNNSTYTTPTLQSRRIRQEFSYYFMDIRFVIGQVVSTKLNGRLIVINNITDTPT